MKKQSKKSKQGLLIAAGVLIFAAAGCGGKPWSDPGMPQKEADSGEGREKEPTDEESHWEREDIAGLCKEIYDRAAKQGTLGEPEVTRSIVEKIGENGYAVVDEENQIDMENPEQVFRFCRSVDGKREDDLTVLAVTGSGGFEKYDLHTKDGRVDVAAAFYQYADGSLKNITADKYPAEVWEYTEEGYLLFGGSHYSESYYALSLSDEPEYTALRVQPLDEACREFNRRYLLPVGYKGNNMFLVDWTEEDFGELDFYDLFDRFYLQSGQQPFLFAASDDGNQGASCGIPADLFEAVIGKYFKADVGMLRQKTTYFPEDGTYEYRPRGSYEVLYPDIPYPEVVSYGENDDKTITLTVNAVYPEESTSRAFTHETVIRPLADGSYQYVSNRIIFPEGGYDPWWYTRRLTKEP